MAIVLAISGCTRYPPPPPHVAFAGLPVSGNLSDARSAGFTRCIDHNITLRCRRDGVTLLGQGPFSAAVDLAASDGRGGFAQLTLWHDRDQYAVIAIGEALERQGWRACFTGSEYSGDQAIYTRPGAPIWFSMDLSYWGKRRIRLLPMWNAKGRRCSA